MTSTIKTSILIISDTHCAELTSSGREDAPESLFKHPLPQADVLIHCGDLTHTGKYDQYERTLDMLSRIKADVKLVIAGNHDLSVDHDFVMSHYNKLGESRLPASTRVVAQEQHARVRELWCSVQGRARREGVTFLDEGDYLIKLVNGASMKIYASPYTPEFHDWAFAYERDEDRFNDPSITFTDCKNIAQNTVASRSSTTRPYDLVLTHGPAKRLLDSVLNGSHAGCPHLLRALMRARPLIHCFGHIHEGWGASRLRWTADAQELGAKETTMNDFDKTGWQKAIASSTRSGTITSEDKARHAVHVDLSSASGTPLEPGAETLFVNAAIMDVRYRPVNAPWLVDIDLSEA